MKKFLCALAFSLGLVGAARADATVVFNEINYHPATNEAALEWVELRNQFAVDVDLSEWSITGEIGFTFPSNAIVRGGGFVLVALSPGTMTNLTGSTNVWGPCTGRLGNNGGTLRLRNNNGRIVDELNYGTDGDWPVAPDGSGVTLAKRDRDTSSGPAVNWTWSDQIGGTPGADNFPLADGAGPEVRHLAFDAIWKYDATGTDLGTGWRAPGFGDGGWSSRSNLSSRTIPGLFNTGVDNNRVVLANAATDSHYVLTAAAQGTVGMNALAILNHTGWSANDTASSWVGVVNPGQNNVAFGAYWYRTTFDLAGFILSTVQVNMNMQADNQITNVMLNGAGLGLTFVGFGGFSSTFTISSGLTNGTNSLEFRTLNDSTAANPHGFRALLSGSGLGANTNSPLPGGPTTYYFRKSFNFSGDPAFTSLRLSTLAADGAVFYLNGNEIYRQNLPGGAIGYATPALADVTAPAISGPLTIPASNLVAGVNVLAVEMHQAAGSPDGLLLGAELISTALPIPSAQIAFNEQSASTNAEYWLELRNNGTNAFALGGAVLALDGATNAEFVLPAGTLAAGQFLALTNTTFGFLPSSGEKIYLYARGKTNMLDAFVVKKAPRARFPDGTGPWLRPSAPSPGASNIFAFRNEIVINEIMYSPRSIPGTNGQPAQDSPEAWIELYNRSTNPVALTGWTLADGVRYNFSPGKTIAPGGYLVVAEDVAFMRARYPALDVVGNLLGKLSGSSDLITLLDPTGNPADQVRFFDGGRWPGLAAGGGSTLELRDPWADNSKAEAWAASDETAKTGWQTYTYRMVAAASTTPAADGQWRDFVLGMLSGGECLVDDISVIQSPTTTPVQFISNGNFSSGQTGWRFVGNHNRSRVIPEPGNPGNNVLYLVATGPQEHMHNHIEATFIGANAVGNGLTYDISFRAKHLAGNNLLNTRLYFNRCARTTALPTAALNGTPGAVNSRFAGNVGPTFSQFGHTRVVPAAGEAVTVSVLAEDPQGVAFCEIRYSLNGAAFLTAPMTNQGGSLYTGVIPGQPASTVVQFYVRAVDGLGAAATWPAAGPDAGALYKVNDGQALLNVAHNIRIVMTPANASLLHDPTNVMSNDLLPCTVIVDEKRAYYGASVRLKSSERGRNDLSRVGYHLQFEPDDLFRGVHPVMLIDRSNVNSPAAEEILLRHMALRAGVPMPHAEICRVLPPVNLFPPGTAIFTPRHEDEFIATAYENGNQGTLFELELTYYPTSTNAAGYKLPQPDGVQGIDFSDLGTNKEPYRYNFIIKNHRNDDDYSRFISFARSWSTPTGATLEPTTRLTTDWDEWMRSYAMVSLFSVNDMYTFGNNHNLLAYQRPSDGKVHYFLWDMDFSLTSGRGNTAALIGDQNLGRILNATPSLQRCFYGYMLDQINTVFNAGYMAYWVDRYDDFAPGASYAADTARIQGRADYARGQITAIAGNPAFAVNGASSIVISNSNLVTLTGTAPITAKTIRINGKDYAVTWTSISAWTVRLPVEAGISILEVTGYDVRGNALTNFTRTITVNYTGVAPVAEGTVVINELHYNPAIPNTAFLELINTSTNLAFDLSGWRLNGLSFTFPGGTILTNRALVVLAADAASYTAAYPSNPAPAGIFSGSLQNAGETITLLKPGALPGQEIVVDRVRYEGVSPWSADANGLGWSLQLIDAAQDNARVSNWRSSQPTGVVANDPWRTWTTNFNIGNVITNFLFMYLDTAGSVDIDEISIIAQTGPDTGLNIVQNGGFEAPLAGPWTAAGAMSGSFITTAVAASGTSALRLVASGPGGPGTNTSFWQSLPITTNTVYTLRLRYLPTTNAANLTARFNSIARPSINVQPVAAPPPPPAATPGLTNNIASLLPPYDPVWLNEIQPVNLTGPLDDVGEREPWVELYNSGTNNVDLSAYFLANNYSSNLVQWRFPAGYILAPGEFRVVWLDGQTNQTAGTNAHASFRPAAGSGALALTRLVSGTPQITDYLTYTALPAGGSYGDFPDGQPFFRQNFYRATAGGTNDNASPPLVAYINEWMAANTGTLLNQSNNNKYDDWFELYNPGNAPADLGGFWLTDNLSNKFMFHIPAGYSIPPHGFLHVWADAAPGLNTNTDPALHVSFKLDQNGDSIGLYGDDGLQVDCVTFARQFNDIAEGRYPDGPDAQWIAPLTVATPAAPNALYANRYPFLAPLPVQTAYVGQPVSFSPPASDPDAPPQVLSFSLLDSPTNAAVHPATGALLWTPTAAQADTTNTVTYRVTDNGAPSLRAERSYTVIVRTPVLLGAITAGPGGAISFTVGTTAGKTYRVEYKDDLNTVPWTTLPPDRVATGPTLTINDTIGANPQRFYRVVQLD